MELFEKVKELLVEELDCTEDEVTLEAHLFEDLDADSLSLMQVVVALEGEYSVMLSDDEIPTIQTVSDAIRLLEEKIN